MKEPVTDAEFEAALYAAGHELIDGGGVFAVRNLEGGGTTVLEAESLSDALFEAWNLVKP